MGKASGYEGEAWTDGGEVLLPRKGLFEKLGQPPWEERHATLIYWVSGAVGMFALLVVALEFGDIILKSLFPGILP